MQQLWVGGVLGKLHNTCSQPALYTFTHRPCRTNYTPADLPQASPLQLGLLVPAPGLQLPVQHQQLLARGWEQRGRGGARPTALLLLLLLLLRGASTSKSVVGLSQRSHLCVGV